MTGWSTSPMSDARWLATPEASSHRHPSAANVKLLLTVNEAANRLGIGRSLMYELIGSGQVESIRVGRLRRVPAAALQDHIASRRAAHAGQHSRIESDGAR